MTQKNGDDAYGALFVPPPESRELPATDERGRQEILGEQQDRDVTTIDRRVDPPLEVFSRGNRLIRPDLGRMRLGVRALDGLDDAVPPLLVGVAVADEYARESDRPLPDAFGTSG